MLFRSWAATTVILMFSDLFQRVVGEKGLAAIERLMGMLLLMISVQMFLDGIMSYFKYATTTIGM